MIESFEVEDVDGLWGSFAAWKRGCVGFVLGVIFIVGMTKLLHRYEGMSFADLPGKRKSCTYAHVRAFLTCLSSLAGAHRCSLVPIAASSSKILLFVLVMTLHSISEGVSIGVSFGGKRGLQLGQMVSVSLAVHNIPEGLAVRPRCFDITCI